MIEQVAISVLGATTVYLTQDHRHEYRKWACIFGLVAQPFWAYAAIAADQWGILFLTGLYTLGWARGVVNFWLRPAPVFVPAGRSDKGA